MKIFLICSKAFYGRVKDYKDKLESMGHIVVLPNCYDAPETESKYRGTEEHSAWKAKMIKHSEEVIKDLDAVLVLNFDKNGQKNYIGGATFLEIYDAFRLGKKIYFVNDLPEGMLKDELIGFNPTIIKDDLSIFETNDVRVGDKLRHYKGGEYKVLAIAEHTEMNEKLVVYQALYGDGRVWARPYDMFFDKVENGKNRFELIGR